MADTTQREAWGSRIGLIMAAAGNAVGIGNFLRFPSKAAVSGGGAFLIPYICALVFLGIPMMWVAWGVGRYGGTRGFGTTVGMFQSLWKNPIAKYLGVLGVAIPLAFAMYYTYIESWMLGYAWQSLTGGYKNVVDFEAYVHEYQGDTNTGNYFNGLNTALTFALIAFAVNIAVLYRGVMKGIEMLAKIGMPILFLFATVLMVRTLMLPEQAGTVGQGLAYIWKPDFKALPDFGAWVGVFVVAAGQIFYSLSIGMGSLETFASYQKDTDDIVLNGLTTSSTNEFVEVIMGGSIAIPATAVFLGADQVQAVARGGTFNLGLVAMPEVLLGLGSVEIFGTMWFFLLFIAAFTSSVAVAQPVVAFFQDEMKMSRVKGVTFLAVLWLLGTFPCVYWGKYGFWEEIDFWAGTLLLIVFSAIEIVIFLWIFGANNAWNEMHKGADINIPGFFKPIMTIITPVYLILLLLLWPAQLFFPVTWSPFSIKFNPDGLKASPRIMEGIEKRDSFQGNILVDKKGEAESKWAKIVDDKKADQGAKVQISIDAAGNVTNVVLQSEKSEFADAVVEGLKARTYKPFKADWSADRKRKQGVQPQPITFTSQIDGLYTAPYISGARWLQIGLFVLFAILTFITWRKRSAQPAG